MLTKIDLDNIDKRTKKTIDKSINEAISDNNEILFEKLASKQDVMKAVSDNNQELFKYLVTKDELYKNFATKDDLHESVNTLQVTMDKIYGIVKKMDEEQTVVSHKVQNYEGRITKLEALPAGRQVSLA